MYTRVYDETFHKLNFRGVRPIRENRENLTIYGILLSTGLTGPGALRKKDLILLEY